MASLGAPTIIAFLAFILVLFPLPWQLRGSHSKNKNIATLSLVFWLAQANFFAIINTYAWADNVQVKLVRYCNICTFLSLLVFDLCADTTLCDAAPLCRCLAIDGCAQSRCSRMRVCSRSSQHACAPSGTSSVLLRRACLTQELLIFDGGSVSTSSCVLYFLSCTLLRVSLGYP